MAFPGSLRATQRALLLGGCLSLFAGGCGGHLDFTTATRLGEEDAVEEQDASLPVTQLPAATDAGRDTRPAPAPDSTRRDSSTAPRDTSAPDSRSPRAEVEPADSRPRDGQAPESPSCGIEVRCGEVEVNTCTDKDHCGGCNHQCPDSAGFIWCKRGHCATEPPSGTCESCRLSVLSGNCCPYGTKFYCTDAKSCDDYPFP